MGECTVVECANGKDKVEDDGRTKEGVDRRNADRHPQCIHPPSTRPPKNNLALSEKVTWNYTRYELVEPP